MMNKLLAAVLLLTALTATGTSHALTSHDAGIKSCSDAYKALQLTRSSIIRNLQQSMRSNFSPIETNSFEGFGIDDTKSYTTQQETSLSWLGAGQG